MSATYSDAELQIVAVERPPHPSVSAAILARELLRLRRALRQIATGRPEIVIADDAFYPVQEFRDIARKALAPPAPKRGKS